MADKRMLNKKVIETDDFMGLSAEAQCLYMHLNLNADDEGILNNVRTVIAMTGCSMDALDELVRTGYVIQILPTIYVITHFGQHNSIPKDRFHKSIICDWKRYLDKEDGIYRIKGRIS